MAKLRLESHGQSGSTKSASGARIWRQQHDSPIDHFHGRSIRCHTPSLPARCRMPVASRGPLQRMPNLIRIASVSRSQAWLRTAWQSTNSLAVLIRSTLTWEHNFSWHVIVFARRRSG